MEAIMREYCILPVYENGDICNYCIGESELELCLESLAFADYLRSVRKRSLKTIFNKMSALAYWYNYIESLDKPYSDFFTLEEQLRFEESLRSVKNKNHKESIYLVGKSDYKKGLDGRTISVYIASINEYYRFLQSFDYIKLKQNQLPFRKELKIASVSKGKKPLPETLTMDDVKVLVDECNTYRDKAIILTMVSTGLRIGELCALKVQSLDFKRQSIKLYRTYLDLDNGVLKTGERLLKGNAVMFHALQQYFIFERDRVAKCDNVFVTLHSRRNDKGLPLKDATIKYFFSKLRDKTGIRNFHAHILRHTFASYFLSLKKKEDNKITLPILQKLMGHKSISTTMIYTHLDYTLDDIQSGKPFEKYMQEVFGE